jgi:hypothetical protein
MDLTSIKNDDDIHELDASEVGWERHIIICGLLSTSRSPVVLCDSLSMQWSGHSVSPKGKTPEGRLLALLL